MRDRDTLENELLELQAVVGAFDGSLRRLAMGDLHQQIAPPLPRSYDGLRKDFNRGMASVSATIDIVLERAREVQQEAADLRRGLKEKADDDASRSATLSGLAGEITASVEAARGQSTHVEHVSAILHNARLDMRRPKEASTQAAEHSQRTCQSLTRLQHLTDQVRALLKETSLLALNGGINAAHSGAEGEEALSMAKNLHALTQQVGATVEALNDAVETATADAAAASAASTQVIREFDALDLYNEAMESQIGTLGDAARSHASAVDAFRSKLVELSRATQAPRDTAPSPDLHLSNIDRAMAEIERQAGRYTPVRVIAPPPGPAPGSGSRSHLRLVKS